jgi:hypothetical protein
MAEENKDEMTWEELLELMQKGGLSENNFCAFCWKQED